MCVYECLLDKLMKSVHRGWGKHVGGGGGKLCMVEE